METLDLCTWNKRCVCSGAGSMRSFVIFTGAFVDCSRSGGSLIHEGFLSSLLNFTRLICLFRLVKEPALESGFFCVAAAATHAAARIDITQPGDIESIHRSPGVQIIVVYVRRLLPWCCTHCCSCWRRSVCISCLDVYRRFSVPARDVCVVLQYFAATIA